MGKINLKLLILAIGDISVLYLSLIIIVFLRFEKDFKTSLLETHLLPFSLLFLFWFGIFYSLGFYDFKITKQRFNFFQRTVGAMLFCFAAGIAFFYLLPLDIAPKTNLLLVTFTSAFLFYLWRRLFYFLFSAYFLNNIAILGTNKLAQEIAGEIEKRPYLGYELVSFIEMNPLFPKIQNIGGKKIINAKEGLFEALQKAKIDTIIVAEQLKPDSIAARNLYDHLPAKIDFIDATSAYETLCGKIPINLVENIWFLENLKEKQLSDKVKRIIDVFLAAVIFLISLPLWLILALAIKIEDNGPVFYCQTRVGQNKKEFVLTKFRSMVKEAEKHGPVWAKEQDPRLTKTGKIIRRLHLDELPQIIGIIKGELSLVGPRPERPEFVRELENGIPHYNIRHLIKPGLTGWAQINFQYARTVMDSLEKFQYDLYYLKNRSLILDFKIMLKTLQLFLRSD